MNTPDGKIPVEPRSPDVPGDLEVDRELRRATRRGFATAGVAILAGLGTWRWLATRPTRGGLAWPLRRVLEANEQLAESTYKPARLARGFARNLARAPRVNGVVGMAGPALDPADWRLSVFGGSLGRTLRLVTLDEIKALPRFEQTTEHKCS